MSIFSGNYLQGCFKAEHPEKCLNYNGRMPRAKPITFRSSWEKIFCNFCDRTNSVIEWGSEVLEVPYYSQIDGKNHVYVTDFLFVCKDKDGQVKKYILEVKPESQTPILNEAGQIKYPDPPQKKSKKAIENWQERCNTLRRNYEKWEAAKRWCRQHGYLFKVLTEEQFGLKYR